MRVFIIAALVGAAGLQTVTAAQDDWPRRRSRGDGLHLRIGRDYHLPSDQIATRPVVVIGGTATIEGRMEGDLVVIGGTVRIGPTAQIHADLVAVGGEVRLADAAQVTGEIHDVSVLWPELRFAVRDWFWGIDRGWWAALSLAGAIVRLTLTMLAACVLALVAPLWIRRIERHAADVPVASGVLGFAAQIMFLPALFTLVIGLIVTIVGIPLLVLVPFALAGFGLLWLAGFTGVAAQIGGRLRARGNARATDAPVLDAAAGVLLLGVPCLIGHVLALGPMFLGPVAAAFGAAGLIIEYLAWTVGLGAALTAPFRSRWPHTPPPIPAHGSAAAPA